MKVAFCDICGKKAALHPHIVTVTGVGEAWHDTNVGMKRQPSIVAKLQLNFQGHQTGYTGAPDVCPKCLAKLASGLLREARRRMKGRSA